jgi:hypothetical protein
VKVRFSGAIETAEQVTSQGRRSQSIPDYDLAGVSIRVVEGVH